MTGPEEDVTGRPLTDADEDGGHPYFYPDLTAKPEPYEEDQDQEEQQT